MDRYRFLAGLHQALDPRSYLEIGVNDGRSLALSRTRSIGVDPDFKIVVDVNCDLQLVKATSDDFFARPDPLHWLPGRSADLTFIDGMHLFEFAFRDFINAEKHSEPTSVIVLDDMLPRSVEEASRVRVTRGWTGDVYKVAQVLEAYRPDLTVVAANTAPTGTLVVAGLDPTSTVLADNYEQILCQQVRADPQDVPADVMHRRRAADPKQLLAAPIWDHLKADRASCQEVDAEFLQELADLRGTAEFTLTSRTFQPWAAENGGSLGRAKAAVRGVLRRLG